MADDAKTKHGDGLAPRQSFADGAKRRRREPQLQAPLSQQTDAAPAQTATGRNPGEVLLTWKVDRVRERPLVSLMVVAILVGLFAWLWSVTASWLMAMALTGIVVVSLAQFLFPTTYILQENGLTIVNIRKDYRPWTRFGIMREHPDAIQVGPRVSGVRARWNRGVLIYFGRADKNRITAIVKDKLGLDGDASNDDE